MVIKPITEEEKKQLIDRFLKRIRKAISKGRTKSNISQEELGRAIGKSRIMVGRYENGSSAIPLNILPLISYVCGFEDSEYFTEEKPVLDASETLAVIGDGLREKTSAAGKTSHSKPERPVYEKSPRQDGHMGYGYMTPISTDIEAKPFTREEIEQYIEYIADEERKTAYYRLSEMILELKKMGAGPEAIKSVSKAAVNQLCKNEDSNIKKRIKGYFKNQL